MEEMEENWKNLINKEVKLIFEDGLNHFSKKIGLLVNIAPSHLILQIDNHTEAILLSKILRIEEIKNEQ